MYLFRPKGKAKRLIFLYTSIGTKVMNTGEKSNVGFSTPKYKAGDQVDIYIDPNEPKTIYSPKDMKGLKIALIISIVVGVIVISLAVKDYYDLKEMNEAYEKYFAK